MRRASGLRRRSRREERFDAVASGATSNAEILRNVLAPFGFGRRRAVCVVAAPPRCSGIAFVADALHPARRRSERGPCGFSAAC
jgi:hypothetical protein